MSSSSPKKDKRRSGDTDSSITKPSKKQKHSSGSGSGSTSGSSSKQDKGKGKSKQESSSKKSARAPFPGSGEAIIKVKGDGEAVGAVLASFGDYTPPSVPFSLYHRPSIYSTDYSTRPASSENPNGSIEANLSDSLILAGETDDMEYISHNWDDGGGNGIVGTESTSTMRGYSGEYLLGIHDPSTSTLTLRSVPLFTISRQIKALSTSSDFGTRASGNMMLDRRRLGEAFGNRKQKANVRNQDRMKVVVNDDEEELDSTMSKVMSTIGNATVGMMGADEVKISSDASRPIPKVNLEATHPSEAYPLLILIPGVISNLLTNVVKPLYDPSLNSSSDLSKLLPSPGPAHSEYLKARLWEAATRGRKGGAGFDPTKNPLNVKGMEVGSSNKSDARTRMRVAYYVALLWAFRNIMGKFKGGKRELDREELMGKLRLDGKEGGELILQDLIARFTESQRGDNKPQVTGHKEALLLTHIFALALHLDGYSVDHLQLASELKLDTAKVTELFKSLGCTLVSTSSTTYDSKGNQVNTKVKKMILKCPITLPVPRRGAVKR